MLGVRGTLSLDPSKKKTAASAVCLITGTAMPFVNIAANILHCPQINWFHLQVENSTRKRFDRIHLPVSRWSRAGHTKSRKRQYVFRSKSFGSDSHPCKRKSSILLHSPSRLHHWKITLQFRRGFCVDVCARSTLKVRKVNHDFRSEICALITSLQVKQVHHDTSLVKSLPLATSSLEDFPLAFFEEDEEVKDWKKVDLK